jgi:hypothetical protein
MAAILNFFSSKNSLNEAISAPPPKVDDAGTIRDTLNTFRCGFELAAATTLVAALPVVGSALLIGGGTTLVYTMVRDLIGACKAEQKDWCKIFKLIAFLSLGLLLIGIGIVDLCAPALKVLFLGLAAASALLAGILEIISGARKLYYLYQLENAKSVSEELKQNLKTSFGKELSELLLSAKRGNAESFKSLLHRERCKAVWDIALGALAVAGGGFLGAISSAIQTGAGNIHNLVIANSAIWLGFNMVACAHLSHNATERIHAVKATK